MTTNPNFKRDLQAWADGHDLKPSKATPCGHGVLGRGLNGPDHSEFCVGQRRDLLDHATLWNAPGKERILVAFPYRPRPDDLEFPSYLYRLRHYVTSLGVAGYMPYNTDPLHRLYAKETCVVFLGPKKFDLAPLALTSARYGQYIGVLTPAMEARKLARSHRKRQQ